MSPFEWGTGREYYFSIKWKWLAIFPNLTMFMGHSFFAVTCGFDVYFFCCVIYILIFGKISKGLQSKGKKRDKRIYLLMKHSKWLIMVFRSDVLTCSAFPIHLNATYLNVSFNETIFVLSGYNKLEISEKNSAKSWILKINLLYLVQQKFLLGILFWAKNKRREVLFCSALNCKKKSPIFSAVPAWLGFSHTLKKHWK